MILSANLPLRPRLDGSSGELLPSLNDLGILDATSPTTSAWPSQQYRTAIRGSVSSQEGDNDHHAFTNQQSMTESKDFEPLAVASTKSIVRLPSFSELASKIAPGEPGWPRDPQSMRRRSSCESNSSLPSLADTATSNLSSPVSSPRTPLDGQFSFHMPPLTQQHHQLPKPLPAYSTKFQLNSTSEYLLAQAKGFDSRSWSSHNNHYHPSSSSFQPSFRHPRYSPRQSYSAVVPQTAYHSARRSSSDESLRRERGAVCKQRSPKTPHINKEYTLEQNLWIIYNHVDLKKPWKEVEEDFGRRFGNQVQRTDGGLQSTYYRWNEECPVISPDGLLEYGEGEGFNKWNVRVDKAKIRTQGKIPVIDRYATEILEAGYPWVQEQDMAKARQLHERRRPYREAYEAQKKARLARLMNCS